MRVLLGRRYFEVVFLFGAPCLNNRIRDCKRTTPNNERPLPSAKSTDASKLFGVFRYLEVR